MLQKKFIWIFAILTQFFLIDGADANERTSHMYVQANNKNMLIGDMRETWMVFQKFWQHHRAAVAKQWQQLERVRMKKAKKKS